MNHIRTFASILVRTTVLVVGVVVVGLVKNEFVPNICLGNTKFPKLCTGDGAWCSNDSIHNINTHNVCSSNNRFQEENVIVYDPSVDDMVAAMLIMLSSMVVESFHRCDDCTLHVVASAVVFASSSYVIYVNQKYPVGSLGTVCIQLWFTKKCKSIFSVCPTVRKTIPPNIWIFVLVVKSTKQTPHQNVGAYNIDRL